VIDDTVSESARVSTLSSGQPSVVEVVTRDGGKHPPACRHGTRFLFRQNPDNLLVAESAAFHSSVPPEK
jgi:hypothetical protein